MHCGKIGVTSLVNGDLALHVRHAFFSFFKAFAKFCFFRRARVHRHSSLNSMKLDSDQKVTQHAHKLQCVQINKDLAEKGHFW